MTLRGISQAAETRIRTSGDFTPDKSTWRTCFDFLLHTQLLYLCTSHRYERVEKDKERLADKNGIFGLVFLARLTV